MDIKKVCAIHDNWRFTTARSCPEKLPLTKHDKMTWELGQMTKTSLFGGGSGNCTNCKVSSSEKKNAQWFYRHKNMDYISCNYNMYKNQDLR